MLRDGLDFSFSGLKTAVVRHVRRAEKAGSRSSRFDLAASFQEADRGRPGRQDPARERASSGSTRIVIGGGVAANSRLRERLAEEAAARGLRAVCPAAGAVRRQRGDDRRGRPFPPAPGRSHAPGRLGGRRSLRRLVYLVSLLSVPLAGGRLTVAGAPLRLGGPGSSLTGSAPRFAATGPPRGALRLRPHVPGAFDGLALSGLEC